MSVPRLPAQEKLDEADASLDQPPGDQAAGAIFASRIMIEPVQAADGGRLARDVKRLLGGRLHGRGQLVAANARFQVGLTWVLAEVPLIELVQKGEILFLELPFEVRRRVEIQDARFLRT